MSAPEAPLDCYSRAKARSAEDPRIHGGASSQIVERNLQRLRGLAHGLEAADALAAFDLREIGGADLRLLGQGLTVHAAMLTPDAHRILAIEQTLRNLGRDEFVFASS